MVHVSVKAEQIFDLLGFPITNSMILSWIVMGIFLVVGIFYSGALKKQKKPPLFHIVHSLFLVIYNLIQSVLREKVVIFFPLLGAYFFYILMNNWMGMLPTVGSLLIKPIIAKEIHIDSPTLKSRPAIVQPKTGQQLAADSKEVETENMNTEHGKIPLLRANTADLNTTFALALVTVFMIQYYGFKYNGTGYLKP